MATDKNFDDLDDLLQLDDDIPATDAAPAVETDPAIDFSDDVPVPTPVSRKSKVSPAKEVLVTPEAQRILDLEAKMSKPTLAPTSDDNGRPLPDDKLTPDQLRIRELEAALAVKNAEAIIDADTVYSPPAVGETVTIHVVADGLTALGETWYRGQQLTFEVGSEDWNRTCDKFGKSWVDLAEDIDAQYEKWGDHYIAPGPWRGKGFEAYPVPNDIPADEREAYRAQIMRAAQIEQQRAGRIPAANRR